MARRAAALVALVALSALVVALAQPAAAGGARPAGDREHGRAAPSYRINSEAEFERQKQTRDPRAATLHSPGCVAERLRVVTELMADVDSGRFTYSVDHTKT